jgi:hypothetical protein
MHSNKGFYTGSFAQDSIQRYFLDIISKDKEEKYGFRKGFEKIEDCNTHLKSYGDRFMNSLAGQCVATYVVGVRDRHPSNFMLQ